jgi:hypothetical protein
MANANTPFGFKPVKMHGSSPMSGGWRRSSSRPRTAPRCSSAIRSSRPAPLTRTALPPSPAQPQLAPSAASCSRLPARQRPALFPHSRAASTACYVLVCTDPHVVYECPGGRRWRRSCGGRRWLERRLHHRCRQCLHRLSGTMLDTSTKATTNGPSAEDPRLRAASRQRDRRATRRCWSRSISPPKLAGTAGV